MIWLAVTAWLAACGVWPFANPDHDMGSVMSSLDIVIHIVATVAFFILVFRTVDVKRTAYSEARITKVDGTQEVIPIATKTLVVGGRRWINLSTWKVPS